jgi:hypothetical protein
MLNELQAERAGLPVSHDPGMANCCYLEMFDTLSKINLLAYVPAPLSTAHRATLAVLLAERGVRLGWDCYLPGSNVCVPLVNILLDRPSRISNAVEEAKRVH